MEKLLITKRIIKLLEYVDDLEGLLRVVQQYAAPGMNRAR